MSDALRVEDYDEKHAYTYADYREWELDEGERFELIDGEAYAMSAPNIQHQFILGELYSNFHTYLQGKTCQVYMAPCDVRLFYKRDSSDDTVVQPDIFIVCDKTKLGPESYRGAPDLIIEILSPSNTAIEMQRKFQLYREAGVREYWVVDPENNEVTVYCFKDGAINTNIYKSSEVVPVGIFQDLSISLGQVFTKDSSI